MSDQLYLTDAERTLRPLEIRDRYRYFATFRYRNIQYTRWFQDPDDRQRFLADNTVDLVVVGEVPTAATAAFESRLLDTVFNKKRTTHAK